MTLPSCPKNFEVFPEENLLDRIPDDTQVVCWGECHQDPLHALFFREALPFFARQNYVYAQETPASQREGYKWFLKCGYRPHEFKNNFLVLPSSGEKTSPHVFFNYFASTLEVVARYKRFRTVQWLKMPVVFVDAPRTNDKRKELSSEGLTRRNRFIAETIGQTVREGKKVLYDGGSLHLYAENKKVKRKGGYAKESVQELLQAQGIKTYAIETAYCCKKETGHGYATDSTVFETCFQYPLTRKNLMEAMARIFQENEQETFPRKMRMAYQEIAGKKAKNEYAVFLKDVVETVMGEASLDTPHIFDLHDYSKHAGKKMPDLLLFQSVRGAQWWHPFSDGKQDIISVEQDAELWRQFMVPRQRKKREERKAASITGPV